MDVVVICTKCGQMAPFDLPDMNHPYGIWHWHQPCPNCGEEAWGSHDVSLDWKTGRPIQ